MNSYNTIAYKKQWRKQLLHKAVRLEYMSVTNHVNLYLN